MAIGQPNGSDGVSGEAAGDAVPVAVPLALSRDVRPGAPLPLHHRATEIVAWRAADGAVRLWRDRCPHRGMRLSFGFVDGEGAGERLHCLYHGWGYGADGACRAIPAHPDLDPPRTIRTEVLAASEAGGLVWLGTPSSVPDGAEGVRTLALNVAEAVARAALRLPGAWRVTDERDGTGDAGPLALALTPHGPHTCGLHVLLTGEATAERRRDAARWGASLRDRLTVPAEPMGVAA